MGLNLEGLGGSTNTTPTPASAASAAPAAPATGGINLEKGQRFDLTKTNPGLETILIGLGWDISAQAGNAFDLDAEVFMLGADGKAPSSKSVVYYGHLESEDGSVQHSGDNLTGAGDGDDETITVNLTAVPENVQKLAVTATIYDAAKRHQNFGQVNNAYIRILDKKAGTELCRFDLSEDYSSSVSLIVAEIYRHNGEWKFNAKGEGSTNELNGLCQQFGIA